MERVETSKYNRLKMTNRIKKQRIIIYSFIIALIILLSFVITKNIVFAKSADTNICDKSYKSVVVHCMDTVESISKQYSNQYVSCESISNEICSINHIDKDTYLIPGNNIIVPFYTTNNIQISIISTNN